MTVLTSTYTVTGMSCDHCVRSVRSEVGDVPGVAEVDVDLGTGTVTVRSADPVDAAAIKDAIEEAGYELAG